MDKCAGEFLKVYITFISLILKTITNDYKCDHQHSHFVDHIQQTRCIRKALVFPAHLGTQQIIIELYFSEVFNK